MEPMHFRRVFIVVFVAFSQAALACRIVDANGLPNATTISARVVGTQKNQLKIETPVKLLATK